MNWPLIHGADNRGPRSMTGSFLYPQPAIASAPLPDDRVAIILRTRDRPLLLERALAGIIGQTHAGWHLYVVIDGGDRAAIDAVLRRHGAALAGRVTAIHRCTPPHGPWPAAEAGLAAIGTEGVVCLHDDDDSWEPGFLAAVTGFLTDPAHAGFVAVSTGCTLIEEELTGEGVRERRRCPWPHGRGLVDFQAALADAQIPPICLAFRRDALFEAGSFDARLRFAADWEALLRLLLLGDIGHIDAALANYHHRVEGSAGAYGNTVVEQRPARHDQLLLLRNAMLRAGLRDRPETLGLLQALLRAQAKGDPGARLDALRDDIATLQATIGARLDRIDDDIAELRQVAAWQRELLRPLRFAWRCALPLRRLVARARGRVAAPARTPSPGNTLPARRFFDLPLIGPLLLRRELVRRYIQHHGRPPQLDPPQGFNAHVIARILHDRDPRLKALSDKLAIRPLIRDALGESLLPPLLGEWENPADVPWDRLPLPFLMKPSHASGLIYIVRTADEMVPSYLTALAASWLARDYFDTSLEWGYRGIPRRLLIQPLLRGPDGDTPAEAQVFTFGGRASHIRVFTAGRDSARRRDNWFDRAAQRVPMRLTSPSGDYHLDPGLAKRLIAMAETMAKDYSHLRVDFMLTDAGPLLSELTAYSFAGAMPFNPPDMDIEFGRLWDEGAARLTGG